MKTILYTREGCHLCDHAKAILEEHGLVVESVDIDQDPELLQKYNFTIPVVQIDGKIRFRGRVHPVLLKRLLQATQSQ